MATVCCQLGQCAQSQFSRPEEDSRRVLVLLEAMSWEKHFGTCRRYSSLQDSSPRILNPLEHHFGCTKSGTQELVSQNIWGEFTIPERHIIGETNDLSWGQLSQNGIISGTWVPIIYPDLKNYTDWNGYKCGTCLNADFASWGRRCLAETSKSLRGWDGQPDVTEPFSVFKFGFKLFWLLTSQLWNKCPKRYTLNCLPWNIARKSPIDRQKITTLEYEMKEYGEVLSSDVKWCQVMSCPDENEVRVVRCGEWNVLVLTAVRRSVSLCIAAQIPREQKGKNKYQRAIVSEISSALTQFDTYWKQEKPRDDINACRVTAKYFLRQLSFAYRVFAWLFEAYMVEFKFKAPVRIFAELRGSTMRRNDEETTPRNARHMTKKGSTPRGYGHTIHPKKALQWQQCAEAKRVSSLYICRIENGGTMWKHVEIWTNNCCLLAVSDSLMYHLEGSWLYHWHEALVTSCSQSFSQGASVLRRGVETFLSHLVEWLECLDPKILDHRPERTTSCSFESSELTREVEKNGREKWWKSDSGHLQEHACAPISIRISIENLWTSRDSSTTLLWTLWTDLYRCVVRRTFLQRSESLDSKHTRLRHKRHDILDIPLFKGSRYASGRCANPWHRHGMTWTS